MIRYFGRHAIDTLRSGRLKVSVPSQLNDPFEFLLNYEESEQSDEVIRKFADRGLRVLSFCDPRRLTNHGDVLMWSHYSAKHTGFRMHIDGRFLREVSLTSFNIEYRREIPLWKSVVVPNDRRLDAETFECIVAVFRAKGMFWRYEKEVRYFIDKTHCKHDSRRELDYIQLPPEAVHRVDVGLMTSDDDAYALEKILEWPKYAHVEMRFARRVKGRFALEYRS